MLTYPMRRTTIYLEPEIEVRLQLEARKRNTPMAEIIRKALREYLDRQPKAPPPGAGEFDSGHTDTADRVEDVLRETGFGESKS